jgi:hypothetical protein
VGGEFSVHQVHGVDALVGGESNTAAEGIEEHIAVASEGWSEDIGLLLVVPRRCSSSRLRPLP